MGNKPITIGLRTDQSSYMAGETATGRVYVSVTKQAQPGLMLKLRLKGEEHAVVHHTTSETQWDDGGRRHRHHGGRSSSSTHNENHYEETSFVFLQVEYPLHTFPNGQVPVGQYEYPFSVHLPTNLPSSMHCRESQSYAEVKYDITATLEQQGNSIFSPNPNAKQPLSIMAVPSTPTAKSTCVHLPTEHVPIIKCCCRNKGSISLETKFDKTVVQPNDVIGVEFQCHNESTARVDGIRIQLEQIVEWGVHRSQHHHRTVRKILDQRDMDPRSFDELCRQSKQEVRRRRRHRHDDRRDYVGASQQEEGSPMTRMQDVWRQGRLQVPGTTSLDSFQGNCIQVRHVATVRLMTHGCCITNPEASTLLQVYRNIPQQDDHLDPGFSTTSEASAPSEDLLLDTTTIDTHDSTPAAAAVAMPSAPPEAYDTTTAPVMAQAQILPLDWNAQTAEVVDIPMVEAVVLESPSWQK